MTLLGKNLAPKNRVEFENNEKQHKINDVEMEWNVQGWKK